jgi:hypothetical protein
MTLWKQLEEIISDQGWINRRINHDMLVMLGYSSEEAQGMLQSHLSAQKKYKLDANGRQVYRTKFMVHRVAGTRTSKAWWNITLATAEASRNLGRQFASDCRKRLSREIGPGFERIVAQNPQARRSVESMLGVIESVVTLLQSVAPE